MADEEIELLDAEEKAWINAHTPRRVVGAQMGSVGGKWGSLDLVLTLALQGATEGSFQNKRAFLHKVDTIYALVKQLPEPFRSDLIRLWDEGMPELAGRY